MNMSQVIKYVNKARKALGLPPIRKLSKGIRGNRFYHPIALAIPGIDVVRDWELEFYYAHEARKVAKAWGFQEFGCTVPLPDPVFEFIYRFDQGEYPELEGLKLEE